jgi:FlaA1/EpsC-like NDP-sugar epimerase
LILQAAAIGSGGEIFVLEMGEPVRMIYLAEKMIGLSGKVPGEDIEIQIIGLRPGEKLHEELFYEDENLEPTSQDKIRLARHHPVDWTRLLDHIEELDRRYVAGDDTGVRQRLADALADLQPADEGAAPSDNVIHLH